LMSGTMCCCGSRAVTRQPRASDSRVKAHIGAHVRD
jgi:hypothetical protein